MKHINKLFTATLMSVAILVGCTEDDPVVDITDISFDGSTVTVTEGFTYDLETAVTVSGSDADQAVITFSSGDASIVSVDGFVLTALKVGKTTLTATETNSSLTATVDVDVIESKVKVTGITLDKSEANVKVGDTFQLTATIAPEDATEKTVTWSVAFPPDAQTNVDSPTDIATVSASGMVTAKAAGNVVITATTTDGSFKASVEVSITNVAVTGVTISPDPIEIEGNAEVQLTATIAPDNAFDKSVTWSLSMEDLAGRSLIAEDPVYEYLDISEDGVIKAIKKPCDGCTYKVKATTTDGAKTDEVDVTITYVPVTEITLTGVFDVSVGDTYQMGYEITPQNASDQTLTWGISIGSSGAECRELIAAPSLDDYATIDENGLVTGVMPYESCSQVLVVEAYSADLDEPAQRSFNVIQLVTSLAILDSDGSPVESSINVECGSTDFGYTYEPGNASNSNVTWTIDNDTDFDIDQNGLLFISTGLPLGTYTTKLTITAQDDSGIKKEITVSHNTIDCI